MKGKTENRIDSVACADQGRNRIRAMMTWCFNIDLTTHPSQLSHKDRQRTHFTALIFNVQGK
jgi:hypothetical protein